jgi:tRNA(Met) cytidine acetyltransferase
MFSDLVQSLRDEARRANERRLLVLTGDHETCLDAVPAVLDVLSPTDPVLVGYCAISRVERHRPRQADALLGTTRECVVLDAHENCHPNAIGRVVGTVDGGGVLVLLAPPLDKWPDRRDRFDETLAVPPDDVEEVTGNFRRRLVGLLRAHEGIAIVDVNTDTIERDGLIDPAVADAQYHPTPSTERFFPEVAYESSRSSDQMQAVRTLERLREPAHAVVVEADRGRGKSSAVGLAAGALAAEGRDVLVTAPAFSGAREVFLRARELLEQLDDLSFSDEREIRTTNGSIRFEPPAVAADRLDDSNQFPDAVVVDEAAALPVALLERFLTPVPVAFVTTIHGYEGAGRGFSVRFRDRLAASDLDVTECSMQTPIRYAKSDPIERWAFRVLLLDARPAVDQIVADALPETTTYGRPTATALLEDEHRLRELFGLLVLAHYRTEPDDLARLLDAPNLSVRTLTHEGSVVSVALLAREGGLSPEMCETAYRGDRIRGNMLPDLLTGQLRDSEAARSTGIRVMRIATHPAIRSRGLGSQLLSEIHSEFEDRVDWFGVSYGCTPGLLRFWRDNGYRMVHLSTTRNETSGEHSAVMLRESGSDSGSALYDRHTRQFRERIGGMLVDTLSDLDPDIIRAALAATGGSVDFEFSHNEWRFVVSAAFGPGQFDMYPLPFRRLVLAFLTDPEADELSDREERLLVRRVLQTHSWEEITEVMDYPSTSGCRRTLGHAFQPLVERYGDARATEERRRYE